MKKIVRSLTSAIIIMVLTLTVFSSSILEVSAKTDDVKLSADSSDFVVLFNL